MAFFLAEAGSNHNGSLKTALELVRIAKESGANAVKFQFIEPLELYVPEFLDGLNTLPNPAFQAREREKLSPEEWEIVWERAASLDIEITASVFGDGSLARLKKLGSRVVKIASTDLTNKRLVSEACKTFDKVIISTGMADLGEVEETYRLAKIYKTDDDLVFMHCVSRYPCPLEDSNLKRIDELREIIDCEIGYSDHTPGTESALLALALGANTFEKHFTYNKSHPGFDHSNALEGDELKRYVTDIQAGEKALQTYSEAARESELQTRIRARRGVYAKRDLEVGEIAKSKDFLLVRPGNGSSVNDLSDISGHEVVEPIKRHQPVQIGEKTIQPEGPVWKPALDYWVQEMESKGMDSNEQS